jgi:hypothetical protein
MEGRKEGDKRPSQNLSDVIRLPRKRKVEEGRWVKKREREGQHTREALLFFIAVFLVVALEKMGALIAFLGSEEKKLLKRSRKAHTKKKRKQ